MDPPACAQQRFSSYSTAKQHCIVSVKKVQCKTKLEHGIVFVLVFRI